MSQDGGMLVHMAAPHDEPTELQQLMDEHGVSAEDLLSVLQAITEAGLTVDSVVAALEAAAAPEPTPPPAQD